MPPKRVRKPTKGKPGKGKPVKAAPALTVPPEEVSQDLPPREAKLLREISVSPRSEPGPMPDVVCGLRVREVPSRASSHAKPLARLPVSSATRQHRSC